MFKKLPIIILFILMSSITLGVLIPTDSYDYKNRFNITNVSYLSVNNIFIQNSTFTSVNSTSVYIPRGAGVVSFNGIVSNGDGTVNVSSTTAYCYSNGISGTLTRVNIPFTVLTPTDDWKTNANHLYIDCNTNTFFNSYTTKYSFTSSNGRYIKYADLVRDNTSIHIEPSVIYADSGEREAQKSCDLQEYWITESSADNLAITLNSTWGISHTAIDTYACGYFDTQTATTASERSFFIARNGTNDWQKYNVAPSRLNNTHFDNGTGWQAYNASTPWGRCIINMGVETGSHWYFRCVNQYATKELAKADTTVPAQPILMAEHTEFLGVIVFNSSDATQYEVLLNRNSLTAAIPSSDYNSLTNKPDLTIYALNSSLSSYVLTTVFNTIGNWSLDKPNYNTTVQLGNIFYNKSNPSNFINMSNLTGYNTTAQLDTKYLNITDQRYNDSTGFNNLNWSKINGTTFPVACPANTYVTQINNSITCTATNFTGYNTTTQLNGLYASITEPVALSLGNWTLDKVNYNTTVQLITIFVNTSIIQNCGAGTVIQNITASGIQCVAAGGGSITANSFQCGGTDQMYNVSISSTGVLSGVCSAQGGGSTPSSFTFVDLNVTGKFNSSSVAYVTNITFADGTSMITKPTGGSATVPGVDSEVAYRNSTNGNLAGASKAYITSEGNINTGNTSTVPIAPTTGITLAGKLRGGETVLMYEGPAGIEKTPQPHMGEEYAQWCQAVGATGTTNPMLCQGVALTTGVGTIANPAPTYGTVKASLNWNTLVSAATTYGEQKPATTGFAFNRGNQSMSAANGQQTGGFKMMATYYFFGMTTSTAGGIGLTSLAAGTPFTNITNWYVSTGSVNGIWVGFNKGPVGNATVQYWSSNATSGAPSMLYDCRSFSNNFNFSDANAVFRTTIFAKPNGGDISFFTQRIDNSSIAPCAFTISGTDGRLPVPTTPMGWRYWTGSQSVAPAANMGIAMNKIYIASDN